MSLQRGKYLTAVPWGWLPVSDQQEGPGHAWDHKVRIQKKHNFSGMEMYTVHCSGRRLL